MNAEEYLDSLRDGREIWIYGEQLGNQLTWESANPNPTNRSVNATATSSSQISRPLRGGAANNRANIVKAANGTHVPDRPATRRAIKEAPTPSYRQKDDLGVGARRCADQTDTSSPPVIVAEAWMRRPISLAAQG